MSESLQSTSNPIERMRSAALDCENRNEAHRTKGNKNMSIHLSIYLSTYLPTYIHTYIYIWEKENLTRPQVALRRYRDSPLAL